MAKFDVTKVEDLSVKLSLVEGYEAKKAVFEEIIATVQNQDGRVQENKEWDVFGGEYKSEDLDGDFVTCSIIWKTISYQRTSTINDKNGTDDGVYKFKATDTGDQIIFEDKLSEGGTI